MDQDRLEARCQRNTPSRCTSLAPYRFMKKIAFIGGGHIAQAMINGLIQSSFKPANICVSNPTLTKLREFLVKTKVRSTTNNKFAVKNADIVFITVRPTVVKHVINEIKESVTSRMVIVSVAACIDFALLNRYFDGNVVKLMRIMPNIPVKEKKGVIGLIAGSAVTLREKATVTNLLESLGLIVECTNEKLLDKLSLISGCGPGVTAFLIDTLENEARLMGFSEAAAEKIAVKTFEGTIAHLLHHKRSPQTLVKEVATPGGITEKIIQSLSSGYPQLLRKSLKSGYDRITSITKELKEQS